MSSFYSEIYLHIRSISGGGSDKLVEQGLTVYENFDTAWKVPVVEPKDVFALHNDGISRNAIAKQLGCSRATISKIIKTVDP
jgi:hypothetical protein